MVFFHKREVAFKLETLHHDKRPASPQYGKSPRQPDMPHRVNPKIHIVRAEPEGFPFRIECRHPVPVSQHGAFWFTGCSCRILEVTEIVHRAVGRPHGYRRRGKRFPRDNSGACTGSSHADDMGKGRGFFLHFRDNACTFTVRNDCNGTGIAYRVQQFFTLVHDVCRDGDSTDTPDRKITDQVFGRTVEINADPVAFFYSKA